MPLTYPELERQFEIYRGIDPSVQTMADFATIANRQTGTQDYSLGLQSDNFIKQGSRAIDSMLAATGLPSVSADVFGTVGQAMGFEETGRVVGEGLPRGIANFAPMAIAGVASGGAIPLTALLASGALAGAQGYTDTGNPIVGAIQGLGTAAMPGVGNLGGRIASNIFAKGSTPGVMTNLIEYAGSQSAALGLGEAMNQASSLAQGQGLYNPLNPENVFATVAGNIPFMLTDLPRLLKVPVADSYNRYNTTVADVPPLATEIPNDTTNPNRSLVPVGEQNVGRSIVPFEEPTTWLDPKVTRTLREGEEIIDIPFELEDSNPLSIEDRLQLPRQPEDPVLRLEYGTRLLNDVQNRDFSNPSEAMDVIDASVEAINTVTPEALQTPVQDKIADTLTELVNDGVPLDSAMENVTRVINSEAWRKTRDKRQSVERQEQKATKKATVSQEDMDVISRAPREDQQAIADILSEDQFSGEQLIGNDGSSIEDAVYSGYKAWTQRSTKPPLKPYLAAIARNKQRALKKEVAGQRTSTELETDLNQDAETVFTRDSETSQTQSSIDEVESKQGNLSDPVSAQTSSDTKSSYRIRAKRALDVADQATPETLAKFLGIRPGKKLDDTLNRIKTYINSVLDKPSISVAEINKLWNEQGVGFKNDKDAKRFIDQNGARSMVALNELANKIDTVDLPDSDIVAEFKLGDMDVDRFLNSIEISQELAPGEPVGQKGQTVPLQEGLGKAAPVSKLSALSSMLSVSKRLANELGINPLETVGFIREMLRLSTMLPELSSLRFTQFDPNVTSKIFGVSLHSKNWMGLVALHTDALGRVSKKLGTSFGKRLAQAVTAHELYHSYRALSTNGKLDPKKTAMMDKLEAKIQGLSKADQELMLNQAFEMFFGAEVAKTNQAKAFVQASIGNVNEVTADLFGIMMAGMNLHDSKPASVKALGEFLNFFPRQFSTVLKQFVSWALPIIKGAKNVKEMSQNGILPFENPQGQVDVLNDMAELLKTISRSTAEADRMVDQFMNMSKISPEVWAKEVSRQTLPSIKFEGIDNDIVFQLRTAAGLDVDSWDNQTRLTTWEKYLQPFFSLAESHPLLRDIADGMMNATGMARAATTLAFAPLLGKLSGGSLSIDARAKGNLKTFTKSPAMMDAFSDVTREMQTTGGYLTKADKDKIFSSHGLDAEQQKVVDSMLQAGDQVMKTVRERLIYASDLKATMNLATLIQLKNPTGRSKTSEKVATLLHNFNKGVVPQGRTPQDVLLELQAAIPDPATWAEVNTLSQNLIQETQKLSTSINSKPWFFSEMRFGDNAVKWVDPTTNKRGRQSFRTKEEALKYAQNLKSSGKATNISIHEKAVEGDVLGGITPDLVRAFEEFDQVQNDNLERALNAAGVTGFNVPRAGAGVLFEIATRDFRKFMLKRTFSQGREDLNMFEVMMNYVPAIMRGVSNRYVRDMRRLHLLDPEIQKHPELVKQADDQVERFLSPDSDLAQKVRTATFGYFMGYNISTAMVELAQPLFTVASELTRNGAGLAGSYSRLVSAGKELARARTKGKHSDPIIEQMMTRARLEGVIAGSSPFGEVLAMEDEVGISLRQLAGGNMNPLDPGSVVKNASFQYIDLARKMYGFSTGVNSELTFIAAAKLALDKGFEPMAAYDEARRMTNASLFGGGKANRPGAYGGESEVGKTAAATIFALQSYNLGMISKMGQYIKESFKGSKMGLKDHEVANAKKAAVQLLATQVSMAGIVGLPFVGAALALLEEMFPQLEVESAVRETLKKIGGDDEELGNQISDLAMSGMPSMGPIDVSSRFAIGGVLGVNNYNGFDFKNILGPTGSIFMNMANGAKSVAVGDLNKAAEQIAPIAFKKVIAEVRDGEALYDSKGRLLMNKTGWDRVISTVGFQPKVLRQMKTEQRLLKKADLAASTQTDMFLGRLSEMYKEGKFIDVRNELMKREKEVDGFSAVAGLKRVQQLIVEQTTPVDVRREGSRSSKEARAKIHGLFNDVPRPAVSEMQRLSQKAQVGANISLPGTPPVTRQQISKAQMVDYLMSTGLSRPEAMETLQQNGM